MKKFVTVAALTAAMAVAGTIGAFAESAEVVEVQGVKFEIPADIKDLVIVETENLDENELVKVSEKASVEAAKANGEDTDGAGWLFTIGTVSEADMIDARCNGACDGQDFFAEDDDIYYVYYHPTDVRYVRETTDQMKEDEADWSKVNEWAFDDVRNEIVKNNPELDAKHYSYTDLDCYLCQMDNGRDIDYEIHSLEYPDLDVSKFDDNDEYIDELTDDVTFNAIEEPKNPDGECIVLEFPEDNVRYEFLQNSDGQNTIREVIATGDDEQIYYYEATYEDPEDTSTGIMEKWVKAIANGETDDDDDD